MARVKMIWSMKWLHKCQPLGSSIDTSLRRKITTDETFREVMAVMALIYE